MDNIEDDAEEPWEDQLMAPIDATCYRAAAARLNYFALGSADFLYILLTSVSGRWPTPPAEIGPV